MRNIEFTAELPIFEILHPVLAQSFTISIRLFKQPGQLIVE